MLEGCSRVNEATPVFAMVSLHRAIAFALLLFVPAGATKNWLFDDDAMDKKKRPVRKVINLLKDMKAALKVELDQDEDLYDKMACWCDAQEKRLTKAIKDAENLVKDLGEEMEVLTGTIAQLTTQIKNLEEEIEKNTAALDAAHTLRQQQKTEFNGEEKDLMESIVALRAAIVVLEKHHKGSLAQMPHETMSTITAAMHKTMKKHKMLLSEVLSPSDRDIVASLLQVSGKRRRIRAPSYAAESGEIFGILEQMKETFETNLKAAQTEEEQAELAFQELRVAKEKEIAASKEKAATKRVQLADAKARFEECKALIPVTEAEAKADEKFKGKLRERCEIVDREWPVRKATRQEEIEAVTKALELLSSEEAHNLFTRTFNPTLLQESSTANAKARRQAQELLRFMSAKFHNPHLAFVATRVQLDSFKRVKQALEDMIKSLLAQKVKETQIKEGCEKELEVNEGKKEKKEHEKEEAGDTVSELQDSIKDLKQQIIPAKKEIAELQAELKAATEQREEEKKEYTKTLFDQEATQELLRKAIEILKNFYDKDLLPEIPVLAQRQMPGQNDGRLMPENFGFDTYDKQTDETKDDSPFALMNRIIEDSEQMVTDAKREEDNAERAYVQLKKDSLESVMAKRRFIAQASEDISDFEAELVEAEQAMDDVDLELVQLQNEFKHIHKECDFVLKNTELRRQAIDEEVEALKAAHAILSGSNFKIATTNQEGMR